MSVNREKASEYLDLANGDYATLNSIELKKHDASHHHGHFDPKTMTCKFRDEISIRNSRKDSVDNLENSTAGHCANLQAAYDYPTVPATTNRQRIALIKAQIRAQKVLDEVGGTVLGSAMAREFKDNGTASIIGQTVNSAEDLAAAAQIYSNPSFETFRWFVIKDGKIAYQTGATSRLPNHTSVAVKGYTFNALSDAITKLGKVDGVFALHNHPSGNVLFSNPDKQNTLAATSHLQKRLGVKFLGQIVIDHDKYSFHHPDGTLEENLPLKKKSDLSETPELDSPILGMKVSCASDLANISSEIQKLCEQGTDDAQIVVTRSKKVSGIATCKLSWLMSLPVNEIGDIMRRYVLASTGNYVSIVYNRSENYQYDDKLTDCIMKNIFLDAVNRVIHKGYEKSLRRERNLNPDYHAYEYGIDLGKGRTPTYAVEPTD